MGWLYTISYGFDFQGSRRDDADIVYGDLGTAQGLFSALYDGWGVIHRKFHCTKFLICSQPQSFSSRRWLLASISLRYASLPGNKNRSFHLR